MAKLTMKIELSDLDGVKDFFELLADNADCVVEPLKSRVIEWVNEKNKGWVSWGSICPLYIDEKSCTVMLNGVEQSTVTRYNKLLRKVELVRQNPNRIERVDAKSFSINNIGFANFVEWH
jgi:hypothetical protein